MTLQRQGRRSGAGRGRGRNAGCADVASGRCDGLRRGRYRRMPGDGPPGGRHRPVELARGVDGDGARGGQREARRSLAAGALESARLAFYRSSTYHRTAGSMLMAAPVDERLVESNRAQTRAFRAGAALSPWPIEPVDIPFEDTNAARLRHDRRRHRCRARHRGPARRVRRHRRGAVFHELLPRRWPWGYNVVALDGPGQGGALLQQGLTLRPDWDAVMVPVLDWVLARPDVDERRVALIGLSMGAFLGPRTAATERRIAALIADCGSFDMFDGALERMPAEALAAGFRSGAPDAVEAVARILAGIANHPTSGWALRRWPAGKRARHPCRLRRCVARVHVAPVRRRGSPVPLWCAAPRAITSAPRPVSLWRP